MNLEERMISVESSIATLSKVAAQQMLHNRETDEHVTILLGIAKGQEADIRAMQVDIRAMQVDIRAMQSDIGSMQGDISSVKEALSRIETRMDERFDAIMSLLQGLKE